MTVLFGTEVSLCYIIATVPRTGSHLLCETIEVTGIAGKPKEPFAAMNFPILGKDWGLKKDPPFIDYIAAMVENSVTPNGVLGMKVQWDQIERIRKILNIGTPKDKKILDYLFPNALYVYLTRKDIRGLAISYYRAIGTNEWWRKKDVYNYQVKAPDPQYDSEQIRHWEKKLSGMQNNWLNYFKARNITPLHIDYEDLEKDWTHEGDRFLSYLGLDPVDDLQKYEPKFLRQADATTRAWRKRLDAEDADREVVK